LLIATPGEQYSTESDKDGALLGHLLVKWKAAT